MAAPNSANLLASLAEAERTLASARPKRPMSAFDLFAASLKRQYNIKDGTANFSRIMQLITEAWHNLPPGERAPFDAKAREDMQRYLQEERVYDQMQMQYTRLKQIAQQSGALQGVSGPAAPAPRPQPQRQPLVSAPPGTSTSGLLQAYTQAAAQASYQQQQQRMMQQYAYQTQQQLQRATAAAAAAQPQLRAASQIAQQAQQRQLQVQGANSAQATQQQSALLLALANAVDRNNNNSSTGRVPAAAAAAAPAPPPPAPRGRPSSSSQPKTRFKSPHPNTRVVRTPETVDIVSNGVNGTLVLADQSIICGCASCIQLSSQLSRTMTCTQFEIHSGAGRSTDWKISLKVRPGPEPEVPRGHPPMPVGQWLEIRRIDLETLTPPAVGTRKEQLQRAAEANNRVGEPPPQFGGARPTLGASAVPVGNPKVPLQYQWRGGPNGGAIGGGFVPVGTGGGGAFAPPQFKTSNQHQQQQKKQYNGAANRYSAAAVAGRQQERAAAAAAAASAPVGRPPGSGHDQHSVSGTSGAGINAKIGPYTPWRDANDGKFSSINVRWSGERCSVCDADTDFDYDQLITCDMCGITVHQSCYGVQNVPGVDQMWLCRACECQDNGSGSGGGRPGAPAAQCCLCPVAGGALKPTTIHGIWAHVACLQWIPEVSVDDTDAMEPISGIRTIQRERWELFCYVCRQRMGAKIQCKSCYNAYHPLCARIAGFKMEIKDGPKGPDGPVVCISYCGKHSTPQPHLSGVRKVEESEAGGDLPVAYEKPRLWNGQPYPLAKAAPVQDCRAGCARAMEYDLNGRGLVRKQHGTGTGATTEAAFWIPGSIIDLSEEEDMEEEEDEKINEEPVGGAGGGDGSVNRRSSRRIKNNKRSYSNGPASENEKDGENEEGAEEMKAEMLKKHQAPLEEKVDIIEISSDSDKDELIKTDDGVVVNTIGVSNKTIGNGHTASTTNTSNPLLLQRVDSPPGMRTVETALRPAVKKPSAINGERPPAKLRKLNTLHAEEKTPSSFTTTAVAIAVASKDNGDPTASLSTAPQALHASKLPAELVGHWCRIWWPEDNEWYLGVIREYSPSKGQFRVWYEVDNEAEWIDLGREARNKRVQLLEGDDRSAWPGPLPPLDSGGSGGNNSSGKNATVKNEENSGGGNENGGGGGVAFLSEQQQEKNLVTGPAEGFDAVGRKVGIYWDDAHRYYYGTVRSYRTDKGHLILYENGTADWVDLSNCRVEWKSMKIGAGSAVGRRGAISNYGGGALDDEKMEIDNATILKKKAVEEEDEVDHQVAVVCNGVRGTFHSKNMTVTMSHSGKEMSPSEFERLSGRGSAKKWKATIRLDAGDGEPGKTIESWLISLGIWGEDGKPFAIEYVGPRQGQKQGDQQHNQQQRQLRPTRATTETYTRRRQAVRVQNGKGAHRDDCTCVICKQSRRTGKKWAGFAPNTTKANTASASAASRRQKQKPEDDDDDEGFDPSTLRNGKQAYVEAIPQIISTGPRSLELYQAPPSRCWAPGEWAAHRLRYNMAREAKRTGETNSLASLGHINTPPVIISGGSLAICDGNIASVVSLGPGATGGGRTLTLKEKLDLCNATEHDRLSFGKSGIHGWGLYAKVPMRQDTMVVEFRGELLRRSAAEMRELRYLAQGADCYIFNLDDDVVLDATRAGTIARFTNHSCSPSLYTKILALDGELRLAFFARVDIAPGQELTYNYRFKAEEDEERMICRCGAPNCTGFLD